MVAIATQPPPAVQSPTPKRGWVSTYYRNYKGKKLGPYHVRRWKVGKKIHREYIKPKDLEQVRIACKAHKDKRLAQKQCSTWLTNTTANLDYLTRMAKWSDKGKLRSQDVHYMSRIELEGFAISGRPSTRRKVTRHHACIAGENFTVKTIFELDGTTKVFMVPFFTNCIKSPLEFLKKALLGAFEQASRKYGGTQPTPTP